MTPDNTILHLAAAWCWLVTMFGMFWSGCQLLGDSDDMSGVLHIAFTFCLFTPSSSCHRAHSDLLALLDLFTFVTEVNH